MRFLTFVAKNISRRPLRSLLTIFAVAIAIAAVLTLVGSATGFSQSFLKLYESNGIDLIVVRSGSGQRLTSSLDEDLGLRIEKVPGVRGVVPGLMDVVSFEDVGLYSVIVQGWIPKPVMFNHMRILSGRALRLGDGKCVMLGSILASNLGKKVNDKVALVENEDFEVVGIYESGNVFENGSMVVPLDQLQRLMERPHQVTGFSVLVKSSPGGKPIDRVRKDIEDLEKGISAMPVREHVETLMQLRIAKAMAWLTSMLAVTIGAAGMLNTMMMSVHERTYEIGILRAVGWGKRRVISMVLTESLLLTLIGAAVGTLVAYMLVWLLTLLPMTNVVITGRIPLIVMAEGWVIAIAMGFLGGLLSSYRAASMQPTTALRHE